MDGLVNFPPMIEPAESKPGFPWRTLMLWCLPALCVGLLLRVLLFSYRPWGFWTDDSSSNLDFAFDALLEGKWEISEKRRWIYPVLAWFAALLPGTPLFWIPLFQYAAGLVTVLAVGYLTMRLCPENRWLVTLSTLYYAVFPPLLRYENTILGEAFFAHAFVWSLAGFAHWVARSARGRPLTGWWWFFVPYALLVLTKPSARFFWPGLVVALVVSGTWRRIRWPHAAMLALLLAASLTMGKSKQSSWLLYTTAFPLTRLDTPLHADYKREIADLVKASRSDLHRMYAQGEPKKFLKEPDKHPDRPLWASLGREENEELQHRIYRELALEGIFHAPHLFAYVAIQRAVSTLTAMSMGSFFYGPMAAAKFEEHYHKMKRKDPGRLRMLLNVPKKADIPNFEEVTRAYCPRPDTRLGPMFTGLEKFFCRTLAFVGPDLAGPRELPFTDYRPTWMGVWLLGGMALCLTPWYRRPAAALLWMISSYGFGVFLVGSPDPRFTIPIVPVFGIFLVLPIDAVIRLVANRATRPSVSP